MNKKEILVQLERVSNDLDNFCGDSSIASAHKDINNIKYLVDNVIIDLEDDLREEAETEKEINEG